MIHKWNQIPRKRPVIVQRYSPLFIFVSNVKYSMTSVVLILHRSILFTRTNRPFNLQLLAQWPGLWTAARLELTLFWYRPHCFYYANQVVLMLTTPAVVCIYMRLKQRGQYQSKVTPSLSCIHGQVTKHTTVKGLFNLDPIHYTGHLIGCGKKWKIMRKFSAILCRRKWRLCAKLCGNF